MLFSSISFLYYFLPIVILLYMIAPERFKNVVLLIASLFFYAWGEPVYVLLMIAMIVTGYGFGIWIEACKNVKMKRLATALSVAICIIGLCYFKYADFLLGSVNSLFKTKIPLLQVALPIGISFYTFQLLSYLIDVSRGTVKAQRNIIKLATYVAMFPQLIAGPIVRYQDIETQLDKRTYSVSKISKGISRFVIGLAKKVIIANTLGELAEAYNSTGEKTILFTWLFVIAITLQIYFDFSGYSDMAIGLGHILGFDFPENFQYPLTSKSVTEFWRRWHMTLGGWFRDYLYIPLGGNRVPAMRWIFNILIVWMATGLWHGANWNYVIWGLYFALFLVIEKKLLKGFLEKAKVINHIYLLLVIMISFVIFHTETIGESLLLLKSMVGLSGIPAVSTVSLFFLKDYWFLLVISIIGATSIPSRVWKAISQKNPVVTNILEPIFVMIGLLVSTAFLINNSFNPFLYFRF